MVRNNTVSATRAFLHISWTKMILFSGSAKDISIELTTIPRYSMIRVGVATDFFQLITNPKLSSKEMAVERSESTPSLVLLKKKVVQIDY